MDSRDSEQRTIIGCSDAVILDTGENTTIRKNIHLSIKIDTAQLGYWNEDDFKLCKVQYIGGALQISPVDEHLITKSDDGLTTVSVNAEHG